MLNILNIIIIIYVLYIKHLFLWKISISNSVTFCRDYAPIHLYDLTKVKQYRRKLPWQNYWTVTIYRLELVTTVNVNNTRANIDYLSLVMQHVCFHLPAHSTGSIIQTNYCQLNIRVAKQTHTHTYIAI